MKLRVALLAATCCWQLALADATPTHTDNPIKWRAFTFSYGEGKPKNLYGYRASYAWQYERFMWQYVQMHFDISLAHWRTDWTTHKDLNVLGISPIFRMPLSVVENDNFHPYLEGGVGAAFMSDDHVASRNLGANLAFHDILGIGTTIGKKEQFDVSYRFLHYSNAHLAPPNEGVDVKWLLTFGYRF